MFLRAVLIAVVSCERCEDSGHHLEQGVYVFVCIYLCVYAFICIHTRMCVEAARGGAFVLMSSAGAVVKGGRGTLI